jgi:uncharacterized RDD family membrane protein YckC
MNQEIAQVQSKEAQVEYAGFFQRLVAAIIDQFLLYIVNIVIVFGIVLLTVGAGQEMQLDEEVIQGVVGLAAMVSSLFLSWLYFALFEMSKFQATLGKKIMGIKVQHVSGDRMGFISASIRYWTKLISAMLLLIGYFMYFFTEKKQTLHDKLAKAVVVKA